MSTATLPPVLAKRFRSGRACLDFVHTGGSMDWLEPELVRDATSLGRWLAHVTGLAAVEAHDADLPPALALRGAVWRLARARADGRDLDGDDVATLNAAAAAPPPVPRLAPDGEGAPTSAAAGAALSAVARDAVGLLSGPLGGRIRVCAAQDCAFLFVDSSRPGTRRWCSMQRCGNLAKTRAHRAARA